LLITAPFLSSQLRNTASGKVGAAAEAVFMILPASKLLME
jgi:hypothetical protein